jgi:general secretion pathway protein D
MGVVDTANWRKLGHITNKATQLSGNDLSLDNFSIFAKFLEEFGTTRTLSSPRIMAINNQQAILSFAKNQVYFTITAQNTPASTVNAGATGTPATTTVNSTANAVPLGVILVLQPSINMETEEITMHIRPTLSTSVGSVNDPAVAYIQAQNQNASGLSSAVPIVQVKEMDSVMRMKSGQVVVLGGMIDDEYDSYDGGLPGISKLPIIGNLFKTSGRNKDVTQTVIFIRATIMPANNYPKPDKEFYDKFAQDQRYSL